MLLLSGSLNSSVYKERDILVQLLYTYLGKRRKSIQEYNKLYYLHIY